MAESLEALRWDENYATGERYPVEESAIAFVDTIIETLGETAKNRYGLYVGCGNGRNYIKLLEAGYDIRGIDISHVALDQLISRCPAAKNKVSLRNFSGLNSANVWDYLVAIQVFQHGDKPTTNDLFARAHSMLKHGGRLFLRVNSTATEEYYAHTIVEGRHKGSRTILYEDGPKKDLHIHFFSRHELGRIATEQGFRILMPPRHKTEQRKPPKTGTWSQWETIWQKP